PPGRRRRGARETQLEDQRCQEPLEVEEREERPDDPRYHTEEGDVHELLHRELGESMKLDGADAVTDDRRHEKHPSDATRIVEDLALDDARLDRVDALRRGEHAIPMANDAAPPDLRHEHGSEQTRSRDFPGVADERPLELLLVEQPGAERIRQAEAPPHGHGDQGREENRYAVLGGMGPARHAADRPTSPSRDADRYGSGLTGRCWSALTPLP